MAPTCPSGKREKAEEGAAGIGAGRVDGEGEMAASADGGTIQAGGGCHRARWLTGRSRWAPRGPRVGGLSRA
jgi:hypothetical protein